MKKAFLAAATFCLLLTSCGAIGTAAMVGNTGTVLGNILNTTTNAQNIGNILTSVIGLDKLSQADLIGTWQYTQPGVAFTSENLLAKAGGEVAANSAREKLATYYNTLGISKSNTFLQFNQDGSFSGKVDGKSLSGSYTYDESSSQITLKTLLFTLPAFAKKSSTGISILFESKKLLSLMQTVAAISGNSTLSTIGEISQNYDGIRMGFDMNR